MELNEEQTKSVKWLINTALNYDWLYELESSADVMTRTGEIDNDYVEFVRNQIKVLKSIVE